MHHRGAVGTSATPMPRSAARTDGEHRIELDDVFRFGRVEADFLRPAGPGERPRAMHDERGFTKHFAAEAHDVCGMFLCADSRELQREEFCGSSRPSAATHQR